MFALAVVAESDLIAALPRRFAEIYAARHGNVIADAPTKLADFRVNAVASRASMTDKGVEWLFALLKAAASRI
jgi:hypothetical protein